MKVLQGELLASLKRLNRVSLSGLCQQHGISPDDEPRSDYWRLCQSLAVLIRDGWIRVEYRKGERVYIYIHG